MNIVISKKLESDIMNFVKLNEIEDINNFLEVCLYNGFNIAKYGVSPQDNYQNENKPLKIEKYDSEEKHNTGEVEKDEPKSESTRKRSAKSEKAVKRNEEKTDEITKPKKTIRIIKN